MVLHKAGHFGDRVQSVIQQHNIERRCSSTRGPGGMNDVLYQLYAIKSYQKHLVLAHLFDKPWFL